MSIEMLQNISLSAFVVSGILLVIAIVLFFTLGIPQVIGDLSGATARKAIEDIRLQSQNNERRRYQNMCFQMEESQITEQMTEQIQVSQMSNEGTVVLHTSNEGTMVLQQTPHFSVDVEIGFAETLEGIE